MIQSTVTVPEGSRVQQHRRDDRQEDRPQEGRRSSGARAARPSSACPASAKGNPEGYLYPATYVVTPDMTALDLLRQMVAKTVSVEQDLDLATKAKALGYTPEEVLTMASILEYEASRDEDYPKVARVIYNRLDTGMPLQFDATVAYANDKTGTVYTSDAERPLDSPYNTYKNTGLPPGPIGSPGEKTIKAALNPSSGDQRFWVVVNLQHGGDPLRPQLRAAPEERGAVPQVLPDVGRLLRTRCRPRTAPSSGSRSRTRCRRCCTARRTTRSGSRWTYEAIEVDEDGLPDVPGRARRIVARAVADDAAQARRAAAARLGQPDRRGRRAPSTPCCWATGSGSATTPTCPARSPRSGSGTTGASAARSWSAAAPRRPRWLLALAELGCWVVTLLVRDAERAAETVAAGDPQRGTAACVVGPLEGEPLEADIVVSTIPAEAQAPDLRGSPGRHARSSSTSSTTPGRRRWRASVGPDRTLVSGLDLLVHQAALQVALMTGLREVPLDAMRAAAEQALAERSSG